MGKYNSQGADCEKLYCEGNTLQTIAEITGVSVTTLSEWKNRYNWEDKRKEYVTRPGNLANKIASILNTFLDKIEVTAEGISGGADAISKFASALNRLGAIEDLPGMSVTVLNKFIQFVNAREEDTDFKDKLIEHVQKFFKDIRKSEYTGKI